MMYIKEFLGGKYMKKYFIALSIMMLMLSACGHSNDRIDFPQAVLSTPTSIKVNNGISEIYLTPEQLEVKVIHMDHKRVGEKLPVLYASIPVRELLVKGTF